jgi:hypothetical protein
MRRDKSTSPTWFPHLQTKRDAKDFFKFGCIGFSLFWCVLVLTYVYSRYDLCLLLQILFVAALDIKTREVPTVSSIKSLLSQYCKASLFFFLQIFISQKGGRAPTVLFAPLVPWAEADPAHITYLLFILVRSYRHQTYTFPLEYRWRCNRPTRYAILYSLGFLTVIRSSCNA